MNKLNFIIFQLISLLFLANFCFATTNKPVREGKPNIVFILADDLGWADLPCYVNTFNEAPNDTKYWYFFH